MITVEHLAKAVGEDKAPVLQGYRISIRTG